MELEICFKLRPHKESVTYYNNIVLYDLTRVRGELFYIKAKFVMLRCVSKGFFFILMGYIHHNDNKLS